MPLYRIAWMDSFGLGTGPPLNQMAKWEVEKVAITLNKMAPKCLADGIDPSTIYWVEEVKEDKCLK